MRFILSLLFVIIGTEVGAEDRSAAGIQLENVRWQPLPRGIERVYVGPDRRTWMEWYAPPRSGPDLASIREQLACEFNQPSPQIRHADLLLFEPGGRVWFYAPSCRTILAYDGAEWITHPLPEPFDPPYGQCLTRGALFNADANRSAGGTAWFPGRRGVYRFDRISKAWSYQSVSDRPSGGWGVWFAVSPDGQLAVANQPESGVLWIFRDGQWFSHEMEKPDRVSPILLLAVPDAETILFAVPSRRLGMLKVGPQGVTASTGSEKGATAFDSFGIDMVHNLVQDELGRIFLCGSTVDGQANLVAIRYPDGRKEVIQNKELTWRWGQHGMPAGIFDEAKRKLWLSAPGEGRLAAYDLDDGEFTVRIQYPGVDRLQAIDDRGRAYAARGGSSGPYSLVMVYTPEALPPPVLLCAQIECLERPVGVGDDGDIWALDPAGQLMHFDGGRWTTLLPLEGTASGDRWLRNATFCAGRNRVMLAVGHENAELYRGDERIAGGRVLELIENHRELLCRAFGPECSPARTTSPLILAGTAEGHLWILQENALKLLAGTRWYDATEPLIQAGCRRGFVDYLAPIGDGRAVFVSDARLRHDGGRSFLGRFEEGRFRFDEAPHTIAEMESVLSVRDDEGALWVPSTRGAGGTTSDYFTGQVAARLTVEGVALELDNAGLALLADEAGNVWMGDIWGQPPDLIRIWRDGEIVQELTIPAFEPPGSMLSDRPGSVYVMTLRGLQHLVADPPHFHPYRLAELDQLPDAVARPVYRAYSRQGYLVYVVRAAGDLEKARLYLVAVPRGGESDNEQP